MVNRLAVSSVERLSYRGCFRDFVAAGPLSRRQDLSPSATFGSMTGTGAGAANSPRLVAGRRYSDPVVNVVASRWAVACDAYSTLFTTRMERDCAC